MATPKFYFFDLGVVRYLQERSPLKLKTPDFGDYFEAWIHHELRSFVDYHPPKTLHFWRSTSNFEVDFILDHHIAIEVKAKEQVSQKDLRGLRALMEEGLMKKYCVVSFEKRRRVTDDGITIYPWQEFLETLWLNDGLIEP